MPAVDPVVLHADADAFFVACHLAEDASLRGRPVAVAGDPRARRGIVLSASYEARAFGVRTTMLVGRARELCPALLVVAPDHVLYGAYGERLGEVFDSFSPVVERLSIDEAWIDMTGGLAPWGGDPAACARALKAAVRERASVTVSVGVARNKYLAKQASDLDKPDGLTLLLDREGVERRLWPLPVGALYGCGGKTAHRLEALGIATIGDLANAPATHLARALGRGGPAMQARARGEDVVAVAAERDSARSVGAERTLERDVARAETAEPILLALAEEVAGRLRAAGLIGRRVTLKYRTASFATHTHQRTLAQPTAHAADIYAAARALFAQRPARGPARLLGIQVSELTPAVRQARLGDGTRRHALDAAVDAIRERYGERAIGPARILRAPTRPPGSP